MINLITLFIAICYMVLPENIQAELFLIDRIESVVCGPESIAPITNTELTWKRNFDNKFFSLDQMIQQHIVNQQLISEKIPMDPSAPEKHVEGIKIRNRFTQKDLESWFSEIGMTLQEGIDLLIAQYNYEYFIHYKFKSQLVPTDEEVQEYYHENPTFIEGWYEIRGLRISYEVDSRDEIKQQIELILKNPEEQSIQNMWMQPTKIMEEDISSDNKFLTEMNVGEIRIHEIDNSFELYQLLAHEPTKIVAIEDRMTSIIESLNRKKLEGMLSHYNKNIREFFDVITLN